MKKTNPPQSPLPIICLCGSAGALSAYEKILECLGPRNQFAMILVSHRSIDNPRILPAILGRVTNMKVIEASDGITLRRNCLFLCPPHTELTTDGIVLNLKARTKITGWPNLIDVFLTSLADAGASGSAAVILSGMGFDGSAALEGFKKSGGVTFAQSDACRESMPEAAVHSGHVDYFLTAQEIGKRLAGNTKYENLG